MYLPEAFAQRDPQAIAAFIDAFPLGLLIRADAELGLAADAMPFERQPVMGEITAEGAVLRAHVARANPLWRSLDGAPVLVVFSGPNVYVSPNAYPSKAVDGRVVPTWNYALVQVRGMARVVQDAGWLRELVDRLSATHERSLPRPWAPADAPPDYIVGLLGAIVGIEIAVTSWVGKWKLSQNRLPADRAGVRAALAVGADGPAADDAVARTQGAWLLVAMAAAEAAGNASDG